MFSNMGAIHRLWFCVYFVILFQIFECKAQCKEDEFSCNEEQCISRTLLCDGKYDCSNIKDESWQVCETNKCNVTQFHCVYGACVPLSTKCNKIFDCVDGSDEEDCEMKTIQKCSKKWMVPCLSGECIRQDQICDGIKDCADNSDETFSTCFNSRCPDDTFRCKYGACVDPDAICNGIPDCVDYSDELLPECKIELNITSEMICGNNSFKCNSGLCIKEEQLCDGRRDCDDGSDEAIGQCKYISCFKKRRCDYSPSKVNPSEHNNQHFSPILPGNFMAAKCSFPSQPENGIVLTNTGMIPKPNETASPWTILIYTCNAGYSLGTAQSVLVCMNDQWTNPFPKCLKTCPSLVSDNHEIECKHNGKLIPCEQACEGTVANIRCKEALNNFIYQPYNGIECYNTGKWSNELFDCNPECGTLIPKAKALVIHGYTAAKGEFPWHAAVYRRDSIEDDNYEQICGGTLISEKVIISAAHCFWNFNENKPNVNTEKYAVAVGKFYRTWNSSEDQHAQYSELNSIILPNKFRAEESSFANDIAILILISTIKFTPRVRPICVDWGNELYKSLLKPGALGTVAGWGLTEEFGFAAEELQAVRMPYVEYDTCVNNLPETFRSFITHDKICAGYNNGTSICTGDSGGAIAFKKSNRYFIEGVVSVAPAKGVTCDSYQYVAFTSVPKHLDFIMEVERGSN